MGIFINERQSKPKGHHETQDTERRHIKQE